MNTPKRTLDFLRRSITLSSRIVHTLIGYVCNVIHKVEHEQYRRKLNDSVLFSRIGTRISRLTRCIYAFIANYGFKLKMGFCAVQSHTN